MWVVAIVVIGRYLTKNKTESVNWLPADRDLVRKMKK